MLQQELPFDEPLRPGWKGRRYLLCSDGLWHLVLFIHDAEMADTQCCADVYVRLPPPSDSREPMCETCTKLHFAPKQSTGAAKP